MAGLAVCLTATAALEPVFAQTTAPADVVVNMRDVELADVAEQISRITGRTLILDPAVKGTVNVVSADPLTTSGVWELFQSVLRVHGFAVVRSGRVWRVIPQAAAVQGAPSIDPRDGVRAQDVVTRMIRLQNLSAEAAARVLKPLVASFGGLEALPPNSIVVTDYADNVRRIELLARSLDSGGGTSFESISLRYASAREVGQSIQRILGDETTGGGPRLAIDERSNLIIVRGDAKALNEARRVASLLDVPGGTAPITRLIRLSHGDAESVTQILRGIMGGDGQNQATNPVARSLAGGQAAGTGGRFAAPTSTSGGGLAAALGVATSPAATTPVSGASPTVTASEPVSGFTASSCAGPPPRSPPFKA